MKVSSVIPTNQAVLRRSVRQKERKRLGVGRRRVDPCIKNFRKNHVLQSNESRASKVLMYTRSASKISKEVDGIPSADIHRMVVAVSEGDWDNSIFYHSKSYSILYRAYREGDISEEQFKDGQGLLQMYTQFGMRSDLPLSHRLSGSVQRFDVNSPEGSDIRDAVLDEHYIYKGVTEKLKITFDRLKKENKKAWVDVLMLHGDDLVKWGKVKSSIHTDWPQRSLKEQILGWIGILTRKTNDFCVFQSLRLVDLFFLPGSTQNAVMRDHYPDEVNLVPVYGTQTADDVMIHRLKGEHPWACFHPLAADKFSAPHGQKIGSLASCHDEYHREVLSRIPNDMRTIFCHCDEFEQELKMLICDMNLSGGTNIVDNLPLDFKTKYLISLSSFVTSLEDVIASDALTFPLSDKAEALKSFNPERPMLDQDFGDFFIDNAKYNNKLFVSFFAICQFDSTENRNSRLMVSDRNVNYENHLKVNWLLYRLSQRQPQEFSKVHGFFSEYCKFPPNTLEDKIITMKIIKVILDAFNVYKI